MSIEKYIGELAEEFNYIDFHEYSKLKSFLYKLIKWI